MIRQEARVLEAIRAHFAEHGSSPSIREIVDRCGLRSSGSVHLRVTALETQGWIRRAAGKRRTISLVDAPLANLKTEDLVAELRRRRALPAWRSPTAEPAQPVETPTPATRRVPGSAGAKRGA